MSDLNITIGADGGDVSREFKKVGREVATFDGNIKKSTKGLGNLFDGVAGQLAGIASAGAIIGLGRQVLTTTAEFEKLGAVLGNTLGSEALSRLKLKEIQDFAAKTPFGVAELTASFVKLANQGFVPTANEMRKLGDLASSTGKSFDQLAEGILDATTGEYERLKEFGIRAQDAGDKVIFTFKGVKTQVDKSGEAIRNYVTSLGDAAGVSGSMAVISETLTGKLSNLGDAWDGMLVSVGNNTEGVFSGAITVIGSAINAITEYNKKVAIASKYKLNAPISDRLQGLVTRKTSTSEMKLENIQGIQDDVSQQVSKWTEAAKSADDYKNAIRELQRQAARDIKGLTDPQYIKAIADSYLQGMNAIKDAAVNKFAPKASGGFTPPPKKIGLTDEQKEALAQQKRFADYIVEGKEFEGARIIAAIQQSVADQIAAEVKGNEDFAAAVQAGEDALTNLKGTDFFNNTTLTLSKETQKQLQILNDFNDAAGEIITDGIKNTFAGIGTAIGEAFAGANSLANGLGQALLGSLSEVLGQLGKLAIATGVAMLGIKMAFKNPVTAIAAGVALVALSAYVGKKAQALAGSVGSGSGTPASGSGSDNNMQGSTIVSNGGSGGGLNGTVVFEIAGTKLLGVLQATTGRNLRIT